MIDLRNDQRANICPIAKRKGKARWPSKAVVRWCNGLPRYSTALLILGKQFSCSCSVQGNPRVLFLGSITSSLFEGNERNLGRHEVEVACTTPDLFFFFCVGDVILWTFKLRKFFISLMSSDVTATSCFFHPAAFAPPPPIWNPSTFWGKNPLKCSSSSFLRPFRSIEGQAGELLGALLARSALEPRKSDLSPSDCATHLPLSRTTRPVSNKQIY